MPLIRPISDLRNKSLEISRLAHKSKEPVFITRNGEGCLVVMSMASYDKMRGGLKPSARPRGKEGGRKPG